MKQLIVYCAHPISGLTWEEVISYYTEIKEDLELAGFEVYYPMTGKSEIRTDINERFKPAGYRTDIASNHAIFERDQWMVKNSDILYLDLIGAKSISIGCMMELAWAALLGKYTIVVMDEKNLHRHAFVLEAADVVFESSKKAIDYMEKFAEQKI